MKRLIIIFAFMLTIAAPIEPVLAISPVDLKAATDDTVWYDEKTDCEVTGGTGGGAADSVNGHTLPASAGGTGFEEPINTRGQVPSNGGYVTFANNVQKASTDAQYPNPDPDWKRKGLPEKVSMQWLYQNYYITMRWRYVTWNWNGSDGSSGPEGKDFYGTAPRVKVTNPRTGKSIITVILEAGPAPWTGVDDYPNNNPKQGWTNPQDGTPTTYKGRVSGFPPEAIQMLGATMRMQDGSGDDLVYSWADPNALPGPVSGTSTTPATATGDSTDGASCTTDNTGAPIPTDGNYHRNTDTMTCPNEPGITDAGVDDGYANNIKYRIRLCNVQGITVNVLIAHNLNGLINKSKNPKPDGLGKALTGGGFRTMAEQIDLRRKNGCPDIYNSPSSACRVPTARPGYSNHQMGLAIDFDGIAQHDHGDPKYIWLNKPENAATYGLHNLPDEAWHWSVDGK